MKRHRQQYNSGNLIRTERLNEAIFSSDNKYGTLEMGAERRGEGK